MLEPGPISPLSPTQAHPAPATGAAQLRPVLFVAGWALVLWVTIVWRLGYPSFWDPDEATYAQATREMLASHSWLVPLYDGYPFFDKPPLFYLLQMVSFAVLGTTELAARAVPAFSALALIGGVAWFGQRAFDRDTGVTGALMFAVLPATFALSHYAILDMTFTLFLFGGAAIVTISALESRPRLQYVGYVLLAAAVLTKGPVALVLAGCAFLISLVIAPAARVPLMRLRSGIGLLIIVGLSAPWFIYMWFRFGDAFVDGYVLKENLWLFSRPMYGAQPSSFFYAKVIAIGMLPWTPLLIGRLLDAARGARLDTAERLLWAWAIAVVGFFSLSNFRLDHYIFPAAPALALLCAKAWVTGRHVNKSTVGVVSAALAIGAVLIASGAVLIPGLARVPLELPVAMRLLPIALLTAGIATIGQVARARRLSPVPYAAVAGLLAAYSVVIVVALPAFEQAKPTRRLAKIVAAAAQPDDYVAMFRLNRWSSSWRFYVARRTDNLETPADVRRFLARPGRHYCAMLRRDFDALVLEGIRLRVIHDQPGLFTTTGRSLRSGRAAGSDHFIVVTDDHAAEKTGP